MSFPSPLVVQRCGDVPSTISAQHPPRRPRPAPVIPPRWRSLCRRCTEPLEGGKGMGARQTPLMAAPSAHPQAADGCFRAATSLSRGRALPLWCCVVHIHRHLQAWQRLDGDRGRHRYGSPPRRGALPPRPFLEHSPLLPYLSPCIGVPHASLRSVARHGTLEAWHTRPPLQLLSVRSSQCVAQCVLGGNSIFHAGNMLRALGRRANMDARVVIIDDVHYQAADPQARAVVPASLLVSART